MEDSKEESKQKQEPEEKFFEVNSKYGYFTYAGEKCRYLDKQEIKSHFVRLIEDIKFLIIAKEFT